TAPGGDNPGYSLSNNGYAAIMWGGPDGTAPASTSAILSVNNNSAARRGFSGMNSPVLRSWFTPPGATSRLFTTDIGSTIYRTISDPCSSSNPSGRCPLLQTVWGLDAATAISGNVTLKYYNNEINGHDESRLKVYSSSSTSGPWSQITGTT